MKKVRGDTPDYEKNASRLLALTTTTTWIIESKNHFRTS